MGHKVGSGVYTYGFLYNFYAVETGKLAPMGWHVPTVSEFTDLYNYLVANGFNYDDTTTGNKCGKSISAKGTWNISATTGAVGNTDYPAKRNVTKFTALGVGTRTTAGDFVNIGAVSFFWSSTKVSTNGQSRSLSSNLVIFNSGGNDLKNGFSVRLLKDDSTLDILTIDGYTYKTVKIGNQVWMAENLRTTKYNDNTSITKVTDRTAWSLLTTEAYCIYDNESEPLTYNI
jgi:uncharacterized protein (TIGR02145 family)